MARYVGGTGIDFYVGTIGKDRIDGGNGNDRLFGGTGVDRIDGGVGNDLVSSNGIIDGFTAMLGDSDLDADFVAGGDGNDIVAGGWNDRLYGGTGTDVLYLDLRGVGHGVTLDLGRLVTGGTVRNGTGALSGFEGYAFLELTAFDDDIELGGLKNYGVLGGGVDGGDGNDRIDAGNFGSGGGNPFTAGTLRGGNGDDILIGSNGSDSLRGDDGNDRLVAGDGNDAVYGGTGDDLIDLRATGNDFVVGGDGTDTIVLSGARADYYVRIDNLERSAVTISDDRGLSVALSEVERFRFADRAMAFHDLLPDLILGTAANDRLDALHPGLGDARVTDGADKLYGLAGDDILDGGAGGDTMFGGSGADTFIVNDAGDVVIDAEPGDLIFASVSYVGPRRLYGDGASRIELTGTADIDATDYYAALLLGNGGNNRLAGTGKLEGGFGDDTLQGNYESQASYEHATSGVVVDLTIEGPQNTIGAGMDTLIGIQRVLGSAFNDILVGGGNQGQSQSELDGGPGNDTLRGLGSADIASYASATRGVTVDLSIAGPQNTIGAGHDTLFGIEHLFGSPFRDVLRGDAGAHYLTGNGGNDVLYAAASNRLEGGAGADRFVFTLESQNAVAIDFSHRQRDKIDVSAIDADPFTDGDQAFTVVDAFTGHAGQLVNRGDFLIALDIDGNGIADVTFTIQSPFNFPDTAFIL